jgi:small multidrug resistance pump
MGWFLLVLAIVMEVCGTTCMKLSQGFTNWIPSVLVFVFYGCSFTGFIYALKTMELSSLYAIWCGVGVALVAIIGILHFKEPATAMKIAFLLVTIVGVAGLSYSMTHQ